MRAKLDQASAEEILALLRAGFTAGAVAANFGVSYATIANIREGKTYKEAGGPRPPSKKHLTAEQAREIVQLWNEGKLTAEQIGQKFNRSASAVYNICKGKAFQEANLPKPAPAKPRVRLSPIKDKAKQLLRQGISPAEVQRRLKCSVSPVYAAKHELEQEQKSNTQP